MARDILVEGNELKSIVECLEDAMASPRTTMYEHEFAERLTSDIAQSAHEFGDGFYFSEAQLRVIKNIEKKIYAT